MGNRNQVIEWAEAHHRELDLRIKRLTWIDEWLPGAYDIEAVIKVNGREFNGRGTSNSYELSYVKAIAESVERAVAYGCGMSDSNGIAAHTDIAQAKLGAARELIERDRYFNHHYHKIPMQKISKSDDRLKGATPIFKALDQRNIEIEYFELEPFYDIRTVMARVTGHDHENPFGSYIGLSSNTALGKALSHATYEAVRKVAFRVLSKSELQLSLEEFVDKVDCNISDHGLLARSMRYSKLLDYPVVKTWGASYLPKVELGSFKFFKLEPKSAILEDCPLVVVATENSELTQLIIRDSNLSTLRGHGYSSEINTLPHAMS